MEDTRLCLLLPLPVQASLLLRSGGVVGLLGSCWAAKPAMHCLAQHCLTQHGVHAQDGKQVLTGWSDGKIRVFGPESGKELYSLHDAHHGEVSCPG